MQELIKKHIAPFGLVMFIYAFVVGYHYFSSKANLIETTQEHAKSLLLVTRAISTFVAKEQRPVADTMCDLLEDNDCFYPQLQSSTFITHRINEYINTQRVDLSLPPLMFKWASHNPLNPLNKATPFELTLIEKLRLNPEQKLTQLIESNSTTYLHYAIAGNIMEKECLSCHGSPNEAPYAIVSRYGNTSGYGYSEGELSSIISIYIDINDDLINLKYKVLRDAIVLFFMFTLGYTIVVWLLAKKQSLEAKAFIDPLTGLLNRNTYKEKFEQEFLRCRRDAGFLALMTLDIDHFKQYNDLYGHQKGDEVLQKISLEIKHSFQRPSDFIFRVGGEEFVILCSANSTEELIKMGENLRHNIQELNIEHKGSLVDSVVTASIGAYIIDCTQTISFEEICTLSDKALYQAKKDGRNRFCFKGTINTF